jgi:hypothetical protein
MDFGIFTMLPRWVLVHVRCQAVYMYRGKGEPEPTLGPLHRITFIGSVQCSAGMYPSLADTIAILQ